ncbi:MAG TPA: ABC transporter ATP-binding protein [Coxiellaceae bacterium]|nr:ABC transporter ATP-binding protein [Coxiellaceae bacterium]
MILNKAASRFLVNEFKSKKVKVIGLVCMSIFSGIIEAVGIALIFPFIYLLIKPEAIHNFRSLAWVIRVMHITNEHTLSAVFLSSIVALILFRIGYMISFRYFQMKLLIDWKTKLSNRLMKMYLYANYQFHIEQGSADGIRNISTAGLVFDHYVMPIFNIIVASSIMTGLVVLLCMVFPQGALLMSALLIPLAFFYFLFKDKNKKLQKEAQEVHQEKQKTLSKSFSSIREIKIFGKEDFFINIFSFLEEKNYSHKHIGQFLSFFPPLVLEAGVMVGILVLILFYLHRNDHAHAFSVLTVLLMIMFRMLPQINRIFSGMQLLGGGLEYLNIIATDLSKYEKESDICSSFATQDRLLFQEKIVFSNVCYQYKKDSPKIFSNINIVIHAGQFVGLAGKSAAGKSTLVNLLTGLIDPSDGQIVIDGMNLSSIAIKKKWLNNVGYVPQSTYILPDSIISNVAYGIEPNDIDISRVRELMLLVELEDCALRGEDYLYQPIGENGLTLSGGQRQRIGIARALYLNPDVLILDEATANLDLELEENILNRVMSLRPKKTIVFVSHRLHTLKNCDWIYVLEQGKIITEGKFETLCNTEGLFQGLIKKYAFT